MPEPKRKDETMEEEFETVEYDLPELLDGTVDSVVAKLPDMNAVTLIQLRELEDGGKTRKSLLAAIDVQLAALEAAAKEKIAAREPQGPVTDAPTPDEPGPDAGDNEAGTFADAPMPDPMVNDIIELHAALAEYGVTVQMGESTPLAAAAAIRDLMARLADDTLGMIDGPATVSAAIALELDEGADGDAARTVMFADANGWSMLELGALHFDAADFVPNPLNPDSRLLNKAIVFPTGSEAASVAAVWLIDPEGRPARECRLMTPLPVGGGRQASIPAGFLPF
jgi:hypothetical protein